MQIKINSVGDYITAGLVATVIGMGVFFQFKKCWGRDDDPENDSNSAVN